MIIFPSEHLVKSAMVNTTLQTGSVVIIKRRENEKTRCFATAAEAYKTIV